MKIGVLSDTHGLKSIAEKALDNMGDIDILLHAGDLVADARHFENKGYKVYFVAGNCDGHIFEPTEKILEIQGKKIFLTHGHAYRVQYGYDKLFNRAKEISADIVVFGHTHVPENTYIDNILFFNPGSIVLPRGGGPGTYGILEIIDGQINARLNTI
ncbi:MAG TPA: metallophosphoesterase [Thermoanaerobacterales bacterium]|uniref:metallophosphoesterase n=1 Tax=Tepidanaerobacter sp. GT38 TaxID=2722793 RepID=UPI0017B41CF3|nr:metallophosphoesterase [Tepidanaerobacter sp. GT38]MCG1011093.1 metallophosphoesterase [Tepidanaerobacter sp. GT38]HHY41734.1 metallophosphoesterase [Thermoanaerobacterales bacterium]